MTVNDEDAVPSSSGGVAFSSKMDQPTVWSGVRLMAVCTSVPDSVMGIDMVPKVLWVPEALPALLAEKPARPLLVMDETMVTEEGVSLRRTSWVRLRYILQTSFGSADHCTIRAWEPFRSHLDVGGDGSHVTDFVMEILFLTDPITRNILAGVDRERIGGMRDIFLSPGKG